MSVKTRYDLLLRLLYPHNNNGRSLGYEQSQNGMTISDWSPHNVRRLFISPHNMALQFYVSVSRKPFRVVKSSIRISDEVLSNEITMIQNGEEVKGVLKALTAYKQFSDIQEIIFCEYERYYSLLRYDLTKGIVKGLSGGTDNISENLKRKYPRLYQIGYSNLSLENLVKIATNEARSLNKPLSLFDKGYQYAYRCNDNSCFKSKFIKPSDYACDVIIDNVITKSIDEFIENEEQKKKERITNSKSYSIDDKAIKGLQSKYGNTVTKLVNIISMVDKAKEGSPRLYSNLITVSDDYVFGSFDLRRYLIDLLLMAKGSEKQKSVCSQVTNGGTKLPLFDIENDFTTSLCKLIEFARFNFNITNEDIATAVKILLLYCRSLLSVYINSLYIYYDNSEKVYITGFTDGAIKELLGYINCENDYSTERVKDIDIDDLKKRLLALSKSRNNVNEKYDWSKFTPLIEIWSIIADFERSLSSYGREYYTVQLLKDLPKLVTNRMGVLKCGVPDIKEHDDIEKIVTLFNCNIETNSYGDIDKFLINLKYYYISYCAYIVSLHLMKIGSLSVQMEREKLKVYNLVYDDRVIEIINKLCSSCGKYLCMVATKVSVDTYELELDSHIKKCMGVLKEMIK